MTVRHRWILFGTPGVYHLDAPWHPTIPGRETRHEAGCGDERALEVVVEPDGALRCLLCYRKILGRIG